MKDISGNMDHGLSQEFQDDNMDNLNGITDENDSEVDGDVDIYGDDIAVAAVGGLFDSGDGEVSGDGGDNDETTDENINETEDISEDSDAAEDGEPAIIADAKRSVQEEGERKHYREYKVREFFSGEEDEYSESVPDSAGDDTAAASGVSRSTAGEPEPDYMDYIHITSKQLAEERKKKGDGYFGKSPDERSNPGREGNANVNGNKDTGYVRDASKNPAVRKEREKQGYRGPEDKNGDGFETVKGRPGSERPRPPARYDTGQAKSRDAAVRPDTGKTTPPRPETGRTAPPKAETGKTPPRPGTGRYGVTSGTGKLPVKGNVPRRNEFFETDGNGREEREREPFQIPIQLIIAGGVLAAALIIIIFLITSNASLNRQLNQAKTDVAEANKKASDDLQALIIENDSQAEEIKELRAKLDEFSNAQPPATTDPSQTPTNGQQPGGDTLGHASNPTPSPPPTQSPSRTYTVKQGDTFIKISREVYGTESRWQEISAANNNLKPEQLQPGQVLIIP